ncbi:flagellar hook-length control protein FliK [Vreelandella andesensis]|uniref:Flagellar hook-length control protein FliK n=2 Tax=Vreelandella andesensis TaxID=447567 RepID=A0A3S0W7N1_9GAMM|nr:flagellar hook-length control protein FliK [Halomonas andesensis]
MPTSPANTPAATLQDASTSTALRDVQLALTGEKALAEAPRPAAQPPSNAATPVMPTSPANTPAATLQDASTSTAPRDVQVALTGEKALAEAPRSAAQPPSNAATPVMSTLPANNSANALPNNTGELAQSAASTLLTSALAAGSTNTPRLTPSSVNTLKAEAATAPANVSVLAASLETISAQPFTTMQPGMHALSPLNTALASAPIMSADAIAGLLAEADTAMTTSSTSKGSEQVLPASQLQTQAMPNSPATATLNTPLTSPAWPSQLGQQLIQFAQRGGEHQVKMQLHPAELGPLSITLKVTEQGTQAHFLSSHGPVRQAIEQAIPQLREALAEQGISLGETSVGEQQTPNEQAFAQQTPGKTPGNQGGELGNDSAPSPIESDDQDRKDGRVDLYA